MMDSIRVGIRVRPLLDREKGGLKWAIQGENTIVPTTPGNAGFEFDHVFGEASTTDQIYRTITKPIVHSVMQGFNGTVFAYGQTSSGKTFTMMGTEDQPGVIPLAIQEIFEYIEDHDELEFIVRVSYLEIYKEGICDLLDPSFTDLKIREDKDNNVKVHGLKEYVVTNVEEVTRVIFVGNINRTTGETKMNERSSRSHAVLSMAIESRLKDGDSTVKVASLNLVDLAGSERLNATGAAGKRAQEGIAINKSLFTLKQVISKLAEGNASVHIPYRDSKLTHILKPSLGGNAKTAIVCAVTPAELYETELTLNFAICAMKVKNRPMVNEVLGGEEALKKKLQQLEKENGELRNKLSSSESSLTEEKKRELAEQIEEKESRQSELEARIRSLENIIIKSCKPREQGAVDQQGGKYNRRMTICPALLARGMGSPLLIKPNPLSHIKSRHSITPVVTPDVATHRSVSRLRRGAGMGFATPASSEEAWQSVFDSSGFERELQRLEPPAAAGEGSNVASLERETPVPPTVNVRDLERRRTMFRCATFVVDTPSSNISVSTPDQSGTWTEDAEPRPPPAVARSLVVDAQTQTEEQDKAQQGTNTALTMTEGTVEPMDTVEVSTQTVLKQPYMQVSTQTDLKQPRCEEEEEGGGLHLPHHPPPPPADLDSSTCLCSHRCSLRTNLREQLQFNQDELMMIQEEAEENMVDAQYTIEQTRLELQAERERNQSLTGQLEKTNSQVKDLEMGNSAQEDYLTKMCRESKMASSHHGELEERCSQLETKLVEVEKEREGWREERERWQREREEEEEKLSSKEEEWKEEKDKWEEEKERWVRELEKWRCEGEETKNELKDKEEELKEGWREEKEGFVRAQEIWRIEEEEEWREEGEKWEREREGWREEKDRWDRERQGWREERESWVEERQNWTEGWREEREEWARERETWESEKGVWEVAKTTWETEREEMVAETSVLKEQLQSLQSELEKLPSAKRHCPEPADDPQLTVLMDKLREMERERERESEQFQISYQQKVRELQKAQETVCYLQEQLDEAGTTPPAAQTTPPPSVSGEELRRAEEELRRRESEIQARSVEYSGVCGQLEEMRAEWENLRGEMDTLHRERERWGEEREKMASAREDERRRMEKEREKLARALEEEREKMEEDRERFQNALEENRERVERERMMEEKERIEEEERLQKALEESEMTVELVSSQLREKEIQLQQRMATADEAQRLLEESKKQWQREMLIAAEEAQRALNGKEQTWQQEMLAMEKEQQDLRALVEKLRGELEERERSWQQEVLSIQRKAEGEVAEKEQLFHEQLAEALLKAQSDTEDKLVALEEEMEVKAACERAESRAAKLQAALDTAQESLAKNAALEKEVEELRGQVDTLYCNIADLAQDNYRKMADKEEEWEEEKENLLIKIKGLEDEVARLTSQTSGLQAKLNQAQQQRRQPGPIELAETAAKLRDLQRDNASLKAQVKAYMTYQPSQSSAGAICCDSAGPVTSAAVYHLRGELAKTREEKEKLMARAKKLRAAVEERDELHDLDQKEIERYQNERNIYRAKYFDLKQKYAKFLACPPEPTPISSLPPHKHVPPPSLPETAPTQLFSASELQQQPPSTAYDPLPSSSQPSTFKPSSKPSTSVNFFSKPSTSQPPTSNPFSKLPISNAPFQPSTFNPSSKPSTSVNRPSSMSTSSAATWMCKPPVSLPSSSTSSSVIAVANLPPPTNTKHRSIFSAYLPTKPNSQTAGIRLTGQSATGGQQQGNLVSQTKAAEGKLVGQAESRENIPLGVGGSNKGAAGGPVGIKGGESAQRPAVLHSPNLEERLWDTSVIQTGVVLPPASSHPPSSSYDLNKCHQQ